MTIDEAKKAGFRVFGGTNATAIVWEVMGACCISNYEKLVSNLGPDDFPARAKARDELKRRKAEASAKRVEARVAARKAAGTQVPPPETPDQLDKAKSVESHETPVGETQRKEVVTDETQDKEPVKWAERKKGEAAIPTDSWTYNDVVGPQDPSELFNANKRKGDHLVWQEPDGGSFNHKVGGLGNGGGHLRARYVTPEWKAWKARQDEKDVKATKPVEHKLPDLPSWAPPIPEGRVPLGFGGMFRTVEREGFLGGTSSDYHPDWTTSVCVGKSSRLFYIAPRDSEIVRLNFPWLDEEGETTSSVTGPKDSRAGNKYHRTIHGVAGGSIVVDVYNVLDAFGVTCPACQHAIKKLLCAGLRNKGSRLQDLSEAVESASRAVTLEKQRS